MSRDPIGGQSIGSGDGYDNTGGPFGFLKALVIFVVFMGAFVGLVLGVENAVSPFVSEWAVLPIVFLAVAVVSIGGLYAVLRIKD